MRATPLSTLLALCITQAVTSTSAQAATTAPAAGWGEISGERRTHATQNRAATVIRRVDGQPVIGHQARVAPGPHVILVQWVPKKGLRTSDRTLRLDVKPCRRYVINAQFASPGSSLWQPVVDHVEDIPGCRSGPVTPGPALGPAPKV